GGGMGIMVTLIPHFRIKPPRLPIWWRWYYWANPVAWSLYGLLTSQYGDVNEPLKLADGSRSVPLRQFLKDQFGYEHEFLGVAATAVVGFLFKVAFVIARRGFICLAMETDLIVVPIFAFGQFTPMVWSFIPF
ncbi:hypothetical protein Tco_0558341, partial [Tanacetum coccineum]